MKHIRLISFVSVVLVAAACAAATEPVTRSLSPEVAAFVSTLPKLRSVSMVFDVPENGLALFKAEYGDPQDCPSGCFFLTAWGLKYADQIGWIEGAPSTEKRYDVKSTDQFLFDESLWDRIQKEWIGGGFRVMLACDTDTPTPALERLAARLPADGWPYLAEVLLEVAQRRSERHIVEMISDLGPSTYNFSGPRAHAASLLASWPTPPAGNFC